MPIAQPPRLTMKTVRNGRNQWVSSDQMNVQDHVGSRFSA
jgi:hypothetical protein